MSSSALQPSEIALPPLRLRRDIDDEHQSARLRLSAAIVAAGAGLWLAWVDDSLWLRLVALASLMFAGRFWASYRKARRLDASAPEYLEITTDHVTLPRSQTGVREAPPTMSADTSQPASPLLTPSTPSTPARPDVWTIPFEHVARIELDEDRIAVVLCLDSGEELTIEPVYGQLTPRELAETLHRYSRARARPGCTELNQ